MNDQGNGILLEDGTGVLLLEGAEPSAIILLENAATDSGIGTGVEILFNNYLFITVGDGMSVGGDKIR